MLPLSSTRPFSTSPLLKTTSLKNRLSLSLSLYHTPYLDIASIKSRLSLPHHLSQQSSLLAIVSLDNHLSRQLPLSAITSLDNHLSRQSSLPSTPSLTSLDNHLSQQSPLLTTTSLSYYLSLLHYLSLPHHLSRKLPLASTTPLLKTTFPIGMLPLPACCSSLLLFAVGVSCPIVYRHTNSHPGMGADITPMAYWLPSRGN
jgi:hypothetical protein